MGQPKALLPLPPTHQPLLAVLVERLRVLAPQRTLIVANDPTLHTQVDLDDDIGWVVDDYPAVGPLGGLATALARCPEWALVVACDLPLVQPALFTYFCTLAAQTDATGTEQWDAIVPVVDGYPEPLHSLYHRRCLPAITARLASGDRRATSFLPDVRVCYVTEPALRLLDPDLHSFVNANTPAEWAQVLALLAAQDNP